METASITLYQNLDNDARNFTREKNYVIEDINDFLRRHFLSRTFLNIQFQRFLPKIEIKLDLSQIMAQPKSFFYRYAKIENSDQVNTYYYWITNVEWRSTNTVKITLEMDVLNTFNLNIHYRFSNKTLIMREHKDRFRSRPTEEIRFDDTNIEEDLFLQSREIAIKSTNVAWTINANHSLSGHYIKLNIRQIDNPTSVASYENLKTLQREIVGGQPTLIAVNSQSINIRLDFSRSYYTIQLVVDPDFPSQYDVQQVNIGNFLNNVKGTLKFIKIYQRIIDEYSEGINSLLYASKDDNVIQEGLDQDFYLIYKGSGEEGGEALDCYLSSDTGLELEGNQTSVTYRSNDFDNNKIYYFNFTENPNGQFKINNTTYNLLNDGSLNYWYSFQKIADLGGYGVIQVVRGSYSSSIFTGQTEVVGEYDISTFSVTFLKGYSMGISNNIHVISLPKQLELKERLYINAGISSASISPITDIDRTDPQLLKIIDLPYCPEDFSNGFINANWESRVQDDTLHLKNLNTKFSNTIISDIKPFKDIVLEYDGEINLDEGRDDKYESKLYHSDYYQPRAVYDSFAFTFMLETIDSTQFEYDKIENFIVNFVQTTTINSKFLFEFPQYVTGKLKTRDFNNVLVIARNNELPIYNSAYLNYIKTGYNYDLKTKDRNNTRNWIGIGLGAVGSIASFVGGGALGVVGGVGLATSTLAQLNNAISSTAQSEDNMKQKLEQLQMTSSNVAGSDDVDLMKYYSQNRLKVITYKVSDRMKKSLSDLFHFCGYKRYIQDIPNVDSRYRFNFVQCDPVFNSLNGIQSEEVEMLRELYRAGVTFIHKRGNTWDMEQYFENWENSLL